MKKVITFMLVLLLVFSVCSVSFAAYGDDDKIVHSGTAKYNYYTSDYVVQTSHPRLENYSLDYLYETNGAVAVRATVGKTSTIASKNSGELLKAKMDVFLTTSTTNRNVHLQFVNQGAYVGTSISTAGTWYLKSS